MSKIRAERGVIGTPLKQIKNTTRMKFGRAPFGTIHCTPTKNDGTSEFGWVPLAVKRQEGSCDSKKDPPPLIQWHLSLPNV
ncbi:hypothetical protein HNY73_019372 [Argiope bruennichi]|uniref:Uncharacterized protein n=1 Tax=Argiope bruennichi TaxID=94029 RepID=A0A8T0EK55_ARGBR|nr:hypothetical protein HNY73_019372 [Argiope bruennichi]